MRIHGRVRYVRYYPDGQIKSRGDCSDVDLVFQSRVGLLVMEIDAGDIDGSTHYIDVSGGRAATHALRERPRMALTLDKTTILSDGVDRATIVGLPVGATVRLRSLIQTVDDGMIEITSDIDGEFQIEIEAFPSAQETLTVIAT